MALAIGAGVIALFFGCSLGLVEKVALRPPRGSRSIFGSRQRS